VCNGPPSSPLVGHFFPPTHTATSQELIQPRINLALRLHAILLHGVCIIYRQQCAYVLSDLESLYRRVRNSNQELQVTLERDDLSVPLGKLTMPKPRQPSFNSNMPLMEGFVFDDLEEWLNADHDWTLFTPSNEPDEAATPVHRPARTEIEEARFAAHAPPRVTMENDMLDIIPAPEPSGQAPGARLSLLEQHVAQELNLEGSLRDEDGMVIPRILHKTHLADVAQC